MLTVFNNVLTLWRAVLDLAVNSPVSPHESQTTTAATCSRLMRFEPDRIVHIREGSRFLGNASQGLIDQAGEILTPTTSPFRVVPEFQYLRAF
jgi:hypothetical protein